MATEVSYIAYDQNPTPEMIDENASTMLCLNDDCLREIFFWLPLLDLLSISDTCKRFRAISMTISSRKHTAIDLNATDKPLSPYQMLRLIQNFGRIVRDLCFKRVEFLNELQTQKIFDLIVENCSGNLKSLSIGGVQIDLSASQMRPFFGSLNELRLENCHMTMSTVDNSFTECNDLLRFKVIQCQSIFEFVPQQCFPKLETFQIFDAGLTNFPKMLEFLANHESLKHINLINIRGQDMSLLADTMVANIKNFEKFQVNGSFNYHNFVPLMRLKNIRKIYLSHPFAEVTNFLNDMTWVEHLQCLQLAGIAVDGGLFSAIGRLASLRELEIEASGSYGTFVRFEPLQNLGQLTKLMFRGEVTINKSDLVNLVVELRSLRMLSLGILAPVLDKGDIEKLIMIGRSRRVELTVMDCPILPEDLTLRGCLEIERSSMRGI